MAETISIHRCMIVTAAVAPQARALADSFGPSASGMWTTALSPTGELPATHYISAGMIGTSFAGLMSSPDALQAGCAAMGITVPLANCKAVLAGADVSEEQPFDAMTRLGLQMVQEAI